MVVTERDADGPLNEIDRRAVAGRRRRVERRLLEHRSPPPFSGGGIVLSAVILLDTWPGLMAAMIIAGLAAIAVGPSWSRLLRRLLAMSGLMLFVLASLPFTVPGEQIFRLGGIEASREGLMQAGVIIARANTILMMILALWDRCRL